MPVLIRNVFSICMMLILTSCSVFSPVKIEETKTYVLNVAPLSTHYKRKPILLYVAPIESSTIYNTTGMAYTLQPYLNAYFVKNSWADTPANMLRPLVVQAFENTRSVRATQSSLARNYNYILTLQLLELQQDFYHKPTAVHLVVRAQLLSGRTNNLIVEKVFFINKVMLTNTPYSGVIAANQATQEFLRQLTRFCLRYM